MNNTYVYSSHKCIRQTGGVFEIDRYLFQPIDRQYVNVYYYLGLNSSLARISRNLLRIRLGNWPLPLNLLSPQRCDSTLPAGALIFIASSRPIYRRRAVFIFGGETPRRFVVAAAAAARRDGPPARRFPLRRNYCRTRERSSPRSTDALRPPIRAKISALIAN